MTVVVSSGRLNESTIGLITTSRHQSGSYLPWAQHQPKLEFATATDESKEMTYVRENLGFESSRYSRTYFQFWKSEQWTGHTALFMRLGGEAVFARGWIPTMSPTNAARTLVLGSSGPGEWQDDLTMIHDPTCISLELPVSRADAESLPAFWKLKSNNYRNYSFEESNGSCNCVIAAVAVLKEYLVDRGLQALANLDLVTSPKQGPLMEQILSGRLLGRRLMAKL